MNSLREKLIKHSRSDVLKLLREFAAQWGAEKTTPIRLHNFIFRLFREQPVKKRYRTWETSVGWWLMLWVGTGWPDFEDLDFESFYEHDVVHSQALIEIYLSFRGDHFNGYKLYFENMAHRYPQEIGTYTSVKELEIAFPEAVKQLKFADEYKKPIRTKWQEDQRI